MKKTIILIVLLLASLQSVQAYNYNWKEYNIYLPENIEYLEYCYNSNQCEVPNKYKKIINLNILLIKYWYEKLY